MNKENTVCVSWKQNFNKAEKKSKHDNASSTRLILRIPVMAECFLAHINQDSSSCPGERYPGQICAYLLTQCQQGLLELKFAVLKILKLTLTFDQWRQEAVSNRASTLSQKHITMETKHRLPSLKRQNVNIPTCPNISLNTS